MSYSILNPRCWRVRANTAVDQTCPAGHAWYALAAQQCFATNDLPEVPLKTDSKDQE